LEQSTEWNELISKRAKRRCAGIILRHEKGTVSVFRPVQLPRLGAVFAALHERYIGVPLAVVLGEM